MPQAPNLKTMSTAKKAVIGTLIGLGVALILAGVRKTGAIDWIEWQFIDVRTRAAIGSTRPDPRIVIAEVNDSDVVALKNQGVPWPWPLLHNRAAFEWLAECKVAAVLVDVYQFDRGAGEGELWPNEGDAAEASALAAAYERIGKVELAYELVPEGNPPFREPLRIAAFRKRVGALPKVGFDPSFQRAYPALPVLRLLNGARGLGYANTDPDRDGIARRTSPFAVLWRLDPGDPNPDGALPPAPLEKAIVPSLPMATALEVGGSAGPFDADGLRIGSVRQPLDDAHKFLVNFRGGRNSYPRVSPAQLVLNGLALVEAEPGSPRYRGPPDDEPVSRKNLEGKIVIWGVNISGIHDVVATPISEIFPGPEFQATLVDNLLHGDGRVSASFAWNFAILAGLCGLLGLLGSAVQVRGALLVGTAVLGGGLHFAASRLFVSGWSIDLFTPALGLGFTYAGVTAFHLLTEGKRNKWLEGTFSQYLSPAIIEELKANPEMLGLGGRHAEITVLFSDVKGFTTLSENLSDSDLVRLLNRYLTGQSMQVLAEDGLIDKFIGDALMAFFGDPVPQGDHAIRACRAAIRCRQVLPALKPLLEELGVPSLTNRIGINSGPARVGNMGSDMRLSYTAMGDTVNLASRLEGANKAFGSAILLGPLTYEHAKDAIVAKPIGRLQVVGKQEAEAVYELLDLADEATPETKKHAAAYGLAHAAVLADDLDAADRALAEAQALRPGDGPTAWLSGIARDLRAGKMARPWSGVIVLDSK